MIIPASEFMMILPEIFVLSMACIILVLDLFLSKSDQLLAGVADPGVCCGDHSVDQQG